MNVHLGDEYLWANLPSGVSTPAWRRPALLLASAGGWKEMNSCENELRSQKADTKGRLLIFYFFHLKLHILQTEWSHPQSAELARPSPPPDGARRSFRSTTWLLGSEEPLTDGEGP